MSAPAYLLEPAFQGHWLLWQHRGRPGNLGGHVYMFSPDCNPATRLLLEEAAQTYCQLSKNKEVGPYVTFQGLPVLVATRTSVNVLITQRPSLQPLHCRGARR